jgi:hypothetical protein
MLLVDGRLPGDEIRRESSEINAAVISDENRWRKADVEARMSK